MNELILKYARPKHAFALIYLRYDHKNLVGAYTILSGNGPNAPATNHLKAPLKSDFPNWENQIAIKDIRSQLGKSDQKLFEIKQEPSRSPRNTYIISLILSNFDIFFYHHHNQSPSILKYHHYKFKDGQTMDFNRPRRLRDLPGVPTGH